ncbi:MAG: Rrf2 family transcriptional regulator [Acidobacteria bacterium]|nr:Rrf2 family transcriptional regulator [Acidobacteriota bacterium]
MLGKTSISAVRALLLLAGQDVQEPWSPRRIAEVLGESPSYMAKVVRHLVKVGILEAERGVKGGVRLVENPANIRLLDVVEACHGRIGADYCRSVPEGTTTCSFHKAAHELHQAITGVLGGWTIADLLAGYFLQQKGPGALCLLSGVPAPLPRR